ncbi:MAG: MFS transporter [Sphingobacteriales bacterium]|nr:MFS transporter [Sphingobacteriales bacterium]OJW37328.1 MAG: MFS transporter [Sphingobacteriales bacterium 46-32]
MNGPGFTPSPQVSQEDLKKSLRLVIYDGLTTEVMTTFTGSTFLVAMGVLYGASNFQIGILASLPTFTNVFQLMSIWLVRRYSSRRLVSVVCTILARIPLLCVGAMIFFFASSFASILFFLFFFYLFGSIAGPTWNSWMKDLIPENTLGAFFARRGRYTQTLNVVLSLGLALLVDYIKDRYPEYELTTYAAFFVVAGIAGLMGALFLGKTYEPRSLLSNENIFRMLRKPLVNPNFRRLLMFNSVWLFALNFATPFFTVFLLRSMKVQLSYIIVLAAIGQVAGIFALRVWGRYADRYSNKTIIAICAPLYIACLVSWCFVGIYSNFYNNLILLVCIFIFSGISTSGINLSLTNIGLKLAPATESIVYLSAKNIVTSVFSATAPLAGGIVADYFTARSLDASATWSGPGLVKTFRLLELHDFNFLFAIAALLAFFSLELLARIKEEGEVDKDEVVRVMRSNIKNNIKDAFVVGQLIDWHQQFWSIFRRRSRLHDAGEASAAKPDDDKRK